MKLHTFESSETISAPIGAVFEFFSAAENLQRLTPDFLRFEILTPLPIEMRPGALIEYRLRLIGIPFRWVTEITTWEAGQRFVDVQRKGPYLLWEHEHRFAALGDQTVMEDHLRYAVPGGPLEPLIYALFVRKRVEEIFAYRSKAIREIFPD